MAITYRIGIMPGPWPPGRESGLFLFTLAEFCEKNDIDSIWLSDRLSSPAPVPEVMTSLAAIAARTQKLKFGPSVLVLPYRTPVVAAKEMATIDWLSRGRLFPAVGIGVELPREFDASGVPFKERGRRTDEAIRVMRLLWTQDEVSYQGEFFKLDRVTIFPKPWQNPPPIWIGGKSEAAQKRTARLGDGWIPVLHHSRGVPGGRAEGAGARGGGEQAGSRGPLRDAHQLHGGRKRSRGAGAGPA